MSLVNYYPKPKQKYIPVQYTCMSFQSVIYYLREYLFPFGCGGCGESLDGARDALSGLCEKCRTLFTSALESERRCNFCGKPLISERETCLSCREKGAAEKGYYNESLARIRVLFPYAGIFRSLLAAYKFNKSLGVGIFLARCLASSLESFDSEHLKEAAWVPVPPRPGKIKKQGWDQIEFLSKQLGNSGLDSIPVRRCLKRLRSRSQKELNQEERMTNLKGRILCVKKPPETAVLFDDVITTGATLNACAAALLEAGCKKVYGVCLFFN